MVARHGQCGQEKAGRDRTATAKCGSSLDHLWREDHFRVVLGVVVVPQLSVDAGAVDRPFAASDGTGVSEFGSSATRL